MTEIGRVVSPEVHGSDAVVTPKPTPTAPLGSATSAFPASAVTSEDAWSAWSAGLDRLLVEGSRLAVIAPHPDDEILGCGGLLHDLGARGWEVQVVTVTDGEGSHQGWADLGTVRRGEQRSALSCLGIGGQPRYLGIPDGEVSEHRDELAEALGAFMPGVDLVVAPWERDGHTDHDAVGRVARAVGIGAGVPVLAHPVWAWQWASIDDLAGPPWRRHDLPSPTQHAKTGALACHRSQTTPRNGPAVLGPEVLGRARRTWEVYARVA